MDFVSFEFYIFLVTAVIVYYIVPLRFRWMVLLAANLCFFCAAIGYRKELIVFIGITVVSWLLEALQYQSPSVVVLDCYMLFIDRTENEASARQALDWMKNDKVKAEAAAIVDSLYGIYDEDDETNRGDIDITSTNESSGELSYLLLIIRYHTRRTDLTEEDLAWWEGDVGILSKGCYRYWGTCGDETDLVTYLEMLDKERYSIFISVKDEASSCLTDEVVEAMQNLGFEFELPGCNRYSYIAIKNEDEITELLGDELLEANGSFRSGRVTYFVTSAGYDCGNTSSIMIDNTEYSKNKRGLNIVVYDNEIKTVIDKVCFDTHVGEWTLTR